MSDSAFWLGGQSLQYDPANKPVLLQGQRIQFASVDHAVPLSLAPPIDPLKLGNHEAIHTAPPRQIQTITFTSTPPVGMKVGDLAYAPAATATSSLPVSFSTAGGNCLGFLVPTGPPPAPPAVRVVPTHAGTCTVIARQLGNTSYEAAPQVAQTYTIGRALQTITFTSPAPTGLKVGDTYTPTAASQPTPNGTVPPNPIVFGTSGGNCSYDPATGKVTMDQGGTCTVTADQLSSADYQAAPQAKQIFGISKKAQAITFTSTAPGFVVVGSTYTPAAAASSGLPVTFDATGGSCSYDVATGVVTMGQVGTCTVTANQSGDRIFAAAPQKKQTLTIATPSDAPTSFQASGGVRSIALQLGAAIEQRWRSC